MQLIQFMPLIQFNGYYTLHSNTNNNSFGHVLNINITWPQAWWSSLLASKTSQLI